MTWGASLYINSDPLMARLYPSDVQWRFTSTLPFGMHQGTDQSVATLSPSHVVRTQKAVIILAFACALGHDSTMDHLSRSHTLPQSDTESLTTYGLRRSCSRQTYHNHRSTFAKCVHPLVIVCFLTLHHGAHYKSRLYISEVANVVVTRCGLIISLIFKSASEPNGM